MYDWQDQLLWLVRQASWPIVIVALTIAIIVLIRGLESRPDAGGRTAIDTLTRLYAAGKISTEEYEERKQKLARAH